METSKIAIRELLDQLYLVQRDLTGSQSDFVQGCKRYYNKNHQLSSKQLQCLRDIAKDLPVTEPRFTNRL